VVVGGRIGPADVPELCARVRAALDRRDTDAVVCDVHTLVDPDMGTVDALARLALAVRRHGCHILLRSATGELRELIALAGLAEVVGLARGLRVERQGKPEHGEHAGGVEEGVDPGDAAV
jgi:hypothetical protein